MHFDLNVPIPSVESVNQATSKKGKGKQQTLPAAFTPTQTSEVEGRIDLLVRLGYTVIAFNQFVFKKIDSRTHVNTAESLVSQLRKRPGMIYLKRLSIILDEDSEKGFGLTNANASLFPSYDLIALVPLTQASFSLACLTHSVPSPVTAHIISLPLTLPRLPYHLKHTLIRTAIKNGVVFEINYVGALGGENDAILSNAGGAENGQTAKRNWWAAAKELVRVTKGKNIITSGSVVSEADLRAPADVANLVTLLGIPQDAAYHTLTKIPKSLVLRAQTRNTYRSVFSEPVVVIPAATNGSKEVTTQVSVVQNAGDTCPIDCDDKSAGSAENSSKKRPREEEAELALAEPGAQMRSNKKKRRKNKGILLLPSSVDNVTR